MTLFKNLVTLAVFFAGIYLAASVVDGKAIVNLDSNALRFEMRFSLPSKAPAEKSVNPDSNKQDHPSPCVVVTPVSDVQNGASLQNTVAR